MILLDIISIILLSRYLLSIEINENNLYIIIKNSISAFGILSLLFWLTKFFNRRIYETIHLIEEYEHKSIITKTLKAYSEAIIAFDNDNDLLTDFIRKLNDTINKSPTYNLHKKKGDNTPIEDILSAVSSVSNIVKKN